ncbi:MAG: tetratricopeptide repeat protein [Cyanobacteria bacterium J06588_4]
MRTIWHKKSLLSLLAIAASVCLIWLATTNQIQTALLNITSMSRDPVVSREIVYSSRCLTNLQQQKYPAALVSCRQAVKINPDNTEAHLNLGLTHFRLEQYQQAITQYQFVLEQNPDEYRASYNWGLVNAAQGNYQEGIEHYNQALTASEIGRKEQAMILNDLGAAQIMLRQYQTAIANLARAIELDSSSLASYFNRGCAYHHQGNYSAGIDDFSRVIALDPNYTEAYISRAILHHLVRQERLAYEDLDVVLEHYQGKGDRAAYQKIIGLKNSMVVARARQTA